MRRYSKFTLPMMLLLTLFAACSAPAEPTDPDPGPTLAACPTTIVIENFLFNPDDCSVTPGTTITFLNKDFMIHTATSTGAAPATFDTGTLDQGESAQVTFTEPGEYPYYCTTHPDMTGSITVE